MSMLNWKKINTFEERVEWYGEYHGLNWEIERTLSMIDIDETNEISILSKKIESMYLELFDKWKINNFQAIHILEHILWKLKLTNLNENARKAYEILLIIFSIYLHENNKIDSYKSSIVGYFNLENFQEYFEYVWWYVDSLDDSWFRLRIILRYVNIPANYNNNISLYLKNDIDQNNFAIKIRKSMGLYKEVYKLIKNNLIEDSGLDQTRKNLLFKYINTFFSFNNYNYILLHIHSNSESIKNKSYILKLLDSYMKTLNLYIIALIKNKEYLNSMSYRTIIVSYSNLSFLWHLIEIYLPEKKTQFDKLLSYFKNILEKKYWNNLNKSFQENDEYSQFIYHYTWESFTDNKLSKKNKENVVDILNSTNIWEHLLILSKTLWVHINIQNTSKAWLKLLPSYEKDRTLINQETFTNIESRNSELSDTFKTLLEKSNIKEWIEVFLRYLWLLLNIEYDEKNIDLNFYVNKKYINNLTFLENNNLKLNDIKNIEKFDNYIIKDGKLFIKFYIKWIYWDSPIAISIDIKNIKDDYESIIKHKLFSIKYLWEILSKKTFNYIDHMSHLEGKLIHLQNYHKETFDHMENVGDFMFFLSDSIWNNKELESFENQIKNQLLLNNKKEVYKFLWYVHDIWKSDIVDRMNRYSMINSKIDLPKYFIEIMDYIFKDISQLEANNIDELDDKEYYKNTDIIKNNINFNEYIKNKIDKIILNLEVISKDENFTQKIIKDVVYLSITEYKKLSNNLNIDKKIINDEFVDNIETIKLKLLSKDENISISKIKWLDLNKFLWIIFWVIKVILNKIIEKIQYPHIKEWFDFVKINTTFVSLTSSFFHHSYPNMWTLEDNWILQILENNYKNIWAMKYLKNLQSFSSWNVLNQEYPNTLKDPIMVITTISDIMEALTIWNRWYQIDWKELSLLENKINKLKINNWLKQILLSWIKVEAQVDFDEQYVIVMKILDNIFNNNEFYSNIRYVLYTNQFKEKIKSTLK